MKRPDLSIWHDPTNIPGLLVFAQGLEEMLFHYTVDTFKAPALNVHSSTMELRYLASLVSEGRVMQGALRPVLAELRYRLKSDPVLPRELPGLRRSFEVALLRSENNPEHLATLAGALAMELASHYWIAIKRSLIEEISKPNNNTAILSLARAFVTQAEIEGFSRDFIYHQARRFFFDSRYEPTRIASFDQCAEFLGLFDPVPREWNAMFRASRVLEKYARQAREFDIAISTERPSVTNQNFKVRLYLGESASYPLFVTVGKIREMDPFMARAAGKNRLDLFVDICRFHHHRLDADWTAQCLVHDVEKDSYGLLNPAPHAMLCGLDLRSEPELPRLSETIEILAGKHFEINSMRGFSKALDLHRAALETKVTENQLLDLWAVLEGFFPMPKGGGDRISKYVRLITPALVLSYTDKLFGYITEALYYGGGDVRGLVEGIAGGGSFFDKVVRLLTCTEMAEQRQQLYASLDHNPLLRFRCFRYQEEFKSTKHIEEMVKRHRERVEWHIQRIYSTRNQIAHNAESLPYVRTLVENLHTYVDTTLGAVARMGVQSRVVSSAEEILELLAVRAEDYISSLEGERIECSVENHREIVFGRENPLAPTERW